MVKNAVTDSAKSESDVRFLPALALALVNHPRATLQELATAIGVSKATLYRFCPTREQLIERLMAHVGLFYSDAVETARLNEGSPKDALLRLINGHLINREFSIFLVYHWRPEYLDEDHHDKSWINGQNALDAFFLRGQNEGAFRIDMSAVAMTEIFYNVLCGLIEAERRGRVPRNGLAQLISASLTSGICKP